MFIIINIILGEAKTVEGETALDSPLIISMGKKSDRFKLFESRLKAFVYHVDLSFSLNLL